LQTISGLTSGHVVTIPSLRVGEVEAQDVVAVVHDVGPSMDGILGNTFLSRFTVTLDPERGLLRLSAR
jgi:predicted aspartyl protease